MLRHGLGLVRFKRGVVKVDACPRSRTEQVGLDHCVCPGKRLQRAPEHNRLTAEKWERGWLREGSKFGTSNGSAWSHLVRSAVHYMLMVVLWNTGNIFLACVNLGPYVTKNLHEDMTSEFSLVQVSLHLCIVPWSQTRLGSAGKGRPL